MRENVAGAMSESVSELVGRCRAGERAAESALAHRAASQALRTASVAMDDLDAARDVSQEVAVRVLLLRFSQFGW